MTESERLQRSSPAYYLAHDIIEKGDHYDDVRDLGFADIRYDTGRDVVDLWWKGPMPPKIRRVVEAGPTRNVQVKVHEANHGRQFLLERARQLHQDAQVDAELAVAGIRLNGGDLALGGAGITVKIMCRGLSVNPGAGAALVRKVGERRTGVRILNVTVSEDHSEY